MPTVGRQDQVSTNPERMKKNATPKLPYLATSPITPGRGTTLRTWKKKTASAAHHRRLVSESSRGVRAWVTVALTIGSPL